ncbi:glycoside hydrolase family 3 protein [Brachybacterium huguangmaarense]
MLPSASSESTPLSEPVLSASPDAPREAEAGGLLSQLSAKATDGDRSVNPELVAAARAAAARGAVLLRNDDDALPLAPGARVALFGRTQKDWIAVGYGSGGDVNAPYATNLLDSLRETGAVEVDEELAGIYEAWCAQNPAEPGEVWCAQNPAEPGEMWGQWPFSYPEMPIDDDAVRAAASRAETAVVVLGRAAGEDRENLLEPGSYYLTDTERTLLEQVTAAFARTVVVLDTGSVIDLAWVEELPVSALLVAWLGGMEGARAITDVLTGAVEPGGRLPDTIARRYEDGPSAAHFGDPVANDYVEDVFVGYRYFETFAPEAVLFPFGTGLTYTTFDIAADEVTGEIRADEGATVGPDGSARRADLGAVTVRARVTNTGRRPGSEVVQVYAAKPDGALSQPARELVGFARTGLLAPGETEDVAIDVPIASLASYDDAGGTGRRSAWVLEPGQYRLFVGADVRRAEEAGALTAPELVVVERLEEAAAPREPFERLALRRGDDGKAEPVHEPVPLATVDLRERILSRLPEAVGGAAGAAGAREVTLADVAANAASLEDFVARLSPEQLASLAYGDVTMDSPLGARGNAGALGGVTESLRALGVPPAITTDGPSGIRISAFASLLPCGTALAAGFDPAAVEELAALHGGEMLAKGSDILLSPGMNIHRDPLCGRNFEYFSEDPLLTGRSAAAVVRGVQSRGVSACPKHFACNNQETARTVADSRVSERALREIYLRGFEICVREASPHTMMTSYNKINGVWGHYHYDLVTTILRGQWGYEGAIVTDWWMQMAPDPDFPALRDSAYRVRAGVDVLMPGSIEHGGTVREDSVVESYRSDGGITLGEMQRTALHVLRLLLDVGLVEGQSRAR